MATTERPALSARDRVMRAAAATFIERGFSNATLSEIADRLGIRKASLYYHFESKDDILASLVSPLLDSVDDFLDEVEAGRPASPATHLARYAAVLQGDATAVAIMGADQEAWIRPQLHGRIVSHQRRLIHLLLGEEQDPERIFRAHMALDILQRGLVTGRAGGLPRETAVLPTDERARLVVRVASEILTGFAG